MSSGRHEPRAPRAATRANCDTASGSANAAAPAPSSVPMDLRSPAEGPQHRLARQTQRGEAQFHLGCVAVLRIDPIPASCSWNVRLESLGGLIEELRAGAGVGERPRTGQARKAGTGDGDGLISLMGMPSSGRAGGTGCGPAIRQWMRSLPPDLHWSRRQCPMSGSRGSTTFGLAPPRLRDRRLEVSDLLRAAAAVAQVNGAPVPVHERLVIRLGGLPQPTEEAAPTVVPLKPTT